MSKQKQKIYDITNSSFRANPFETYTDIRNDNPVMHFNTTQGTFWFVTGYEEAKIVLSDNKRFVKSYENTLPEDQRSSSGADSDLFTVLYHNMLDMDPPDHTRLRGIVSKAFTNRRIQEMAPRIQEIADELIDNFPQHGQIDLIDNYAFPLPIIVIAEILGIPTADRDKFRLWSNSFIDGAGDYMRNMMDFIQYIAHAVQSRRTDPKGDLISALIQAEENGEHLTEQEIYSMIVLLIVAGHETTVNLISNGVVALLEHPEKLTQLRQNLDLTENAIEEFLRYNGAVDHTTARYAAEDVMLGGQLIPRGSGIIISLVAVNRDPRNFQNPADFDINRENTKHLGFGYGVHYCLGAPLARLEGKIAVNTLIQRVPDLKLAVPASKLEYRNSTVIRGLVRLPVQYNKRN